MKHLFTSKTFWFNALTAVVTLAGVLPINKYTITATSAANIGLRLLTRLPANLLPQ